MVGFVMLIVKAALWLILIILALYLMQWLIFRCVKQVDVSSLFYPMLNIFTFVVAVVLHVVQLAINILIKFIEFIINTAISLANIIASIVGAHIPGVNLGTIEFANSVYDNIKANNQSLSHNISQVIWTSMRNILGTC